MDLNLKGLAGGLFLGLVCLSGSAAQAAGAQPAAPSAAPAASASAAPVAGTQKASAAVPGPAAAPANTAAPSGTSLLPGMDSADVRVIAGIEASGKPVEIGSGVTILGPAEATQAQMVRYIRLHNPAPQLRCSVEELVMYYYEEGGREGVRPDVALCQAIKETGCFAYGGDVDGTQNNFCGLGATGHGAPGARFFSARRGVRAHIQHLLAYASAKLPVQGIIDPRYEVLRLKYPMYYGQIPYWTGLNGKWAVPGTHYGEEILAIWQAAKSL